MATTAASEYGFVNARIRGIKSRFLTTGEYERFLQSGSYEEFIKLLANTHYGPIMGRESPQSLPMPDELAIILSKDFAEVSHSISRSLTGRVGEFVRVYMNMFLADSLKSLIRGLHVSLDRDEILRFSVPTSPEQAEVLSELASTGSVQKLIDALPYRDVKVALLTRLPMYEEFSSTAPLEVALEEWFLRSVTEVLKDFSIRDRNRVEGFLESRVDLRNVMTMLRALVLGMESRAIEMSLVRFTLKSKSLVDSIKSQTTWRDIFTRLEKTRYAQLAGRLARLYEDTQDLASVELAIEDYLAQEVKLLLGAFPFHSGIVLGFFSLKFYEIRNIRSIAVGIERGEPTDTIRRMITIW
jgi:vacuolar-type H+-ATPase subunit C/Vma6